MNKLGLALGIALVTSSSVAAATFGPGDAPVAVGSPFGPLAEALGTSYINFGVDFTWGGVEGIFDDPPLAFGGVNGEGVLDLESPVDGRIVVEGTTMQGITDYFFAEAGFAADGSLLLELFDIAMNLLGSVPNGPPPGDNGRTTFEYSGAGIAYFRISGNDSFGVNQISLNTPTAAGVPPIPLPAGGVLLLGALGGLALLRRRQRV
jgi:hypothetical protein